MCFTSAFRSTGFANRAKSLESKRSFLGTGFSIYERIIFHRIPPGFLIALSKYPSSNGLHPSPWFPSGWIYCSFWLFKIVLSKYLYKRSFPWGYFSNLGSKGTAGRLFLYRYWNANSCPGFLMFNILMYVWYSYFSEDSLFFLLFDDITFGELLSKLI